MAVLHEQSSAVKVIRDSNAGMVLAYNGEAELQKIETDFADLLTKFISCVNLFKSAKVKGEIFDQYSAKNITHILSDLLNKAIAK